MGIRKLPPLLPGSTRLLTNSPRRVIVSLLFTRIKSKLYRKLCLNAIREIWSYLPSVSLLPFLTTDYIYVFDCASHILYKTQRTRYVPRTFTYFCLLQKELALAFAPEKVTSKVMAVNLTTFQIYTTPNLRTPIKTNAAVEVNRNIFAFGMMNDGRSSVESYTPGETRWYRRGKCPNSQLQIVTVIGEKIYLLSRYFGVEIYVYDTRKESYFSVSVKSGIAQLVADGGRLVCVGELGGVTRCDAGGKVVKEKKTGQTLSFSSCVSPTAYWRRKAAWLEDVNTLVVLDLDALDFRVEAVVVT